MLGNYFEFHFSKSKEQTLSEVISLKHLTEREIERPFCTKKKIFLVLPCCRNQEHVTTPSNYSVHISPPASHTFWGLKLETR